MIDPAGEPQGTNTMKERGKGEETRREKETCGRTAGHQHYEGEEREEET